MIIFVRFPPDAGFPPAVVEEIVQGCVGRSGSVIGASASAIDVELHASTDFRYVMATVAAELRELGLPPTTVLDVPSRGQRFGINDF